MPVTRILHRAGNGRATLPLAAHPAVDTIEADVWSHGGRILAHHDRTIDPLPLTIGGGRLRRLHGVPLETILDAATGQCGVVLDLRATPFGSDAAADLVRALAEADRARIRVTCEDWALADRVRAWQPDLAVAYSIRSEARFRDYLAERDAGHRVETAVVVRHTLLHSSDEVALLRERAGRVGAWTVDDAPRALTLVAWGVDEVTSNRLTVLNAI